MISGFDRQETAVLGNGLYGLHFAPAVPPIGAWALSPVELFADLQRLPPGVLPSQNFFRMAHLLTDGADALGCGTGSTLSSRPGAGLDPLSPAVRVIPVTRRPVSVSPDLKRQWTPADWVESGMVNPRSARCSRTSPIMGMRLRAMHRVPAGGWFPGDVDRVGMRWRTSPTPAGGGNWMWRHPWYRSCLCNRTSLV